MSSESEGSPLQSLLSCCCSPDESCPFPTVCGFIPQKEDEVGGAGERDWLRPPGLKTGCDRFLPSPDKHSTQREPSLSWVLRLRMWPGTVERVERVGFRDDNWPGDQGVRLRVQMLTLPSEAPTGFPKGKLGQPQSIRFSAEKGFAITDSW